MIHFGSNKVRSIRDYYIKSLTILYGKEEALSLTYGIFEHILGYKKHQLELNADVYLNESEIVDFIHAHKRLRHHEPLQYITEKAWFRNLELYVNKSVLIPRPETEELVEVILNDAKGKSNLNVVDICTGSGCIALSLANELQNVNISALDISSDALVVARKNSKENKLSINLIEHDILSSDINLFKESSLDIIVSNPPYVKRSEAVLMQKNVLDYEPSIALFVEDDDPLLFYRKIIEKAAIWLKPSGMLYFEINESLGAKLIELLKGYGFSDAEIIKDINGKERIVKASNNNN